MAEAIHKEISALLIKGLKDPRIGFVTITAVEATPDLHLARVFFTVMGDEQARKESAAGLKSSTSFLRRELGKRLRARYVPDLLFVYDTSIDYANRIEDLIRQTHSDDTGHSKND